MVVIDCMFEWMKELMGEGIEMENVVLYTLGVRIEFLQLPSKAPHPGRN